MVLSSEVKKYIADNEEMIKKGGQNFSNVELFGRVLLISFFRKNGFFLKNGEKTKISDIKSKIGLIEKYEQLFDKLLSIMVREDIISINSDIITVSSKIDSPEYANITKDIDGFKNSMIEKFEDMRPNFALLEACISNYDEIFSGRATANSVMFPMFSIDLVQAIFKGNRLVDYFNNLIANIIVDYASVHSTRTIKILEIGSGTGGTSDFVIAKLKKKSNVEFYFTDISKIFLKKAQSRLSADFPFVKYEKLDIETDPTSQNFQLESFDIIFASNVIHATANIRAGVDNIHKLLIKNGIFLLNELTAVQDFATFTFGLMDGWWKFQDSDIRMPGSPLLNSEGWIKLLESYNFHNVKVLSASGLDKPNSFSQTLFIGEK